MSSSDRAVDRAPLLSVALVSLGVLALQISLTRVFSLLIWYHFAFLAIALALLGFTAGGVISQLRPSLREGDTARALAVLSYGFALSSAVAILVASHLPFAQSVLASPGQFALFVLLVLVVLLPFLFAGTIVATALGAWRRAVARLYFADLVGSGIGCGVIVWVLDHLGGGAAGVLVGGLAGALGGLSFARQAETGRTRLYGVGAIVTAALLGLLAAAHDPLHGLFYLPNAKIFPRIPRELILSRRCTSVACVDTFRDAFHFGAWGVNRRFTGQIPEQIGYSIDAWALTSTYRAARRPDGGFEYRNPVFEVLPASAVHQVNRALARPARRMLVLGTGGGVDVRSALHYGVAEIEAVDINPTILGAVYNDYNDFSGHLYRLPNVHVALAEGRSYLRRSPRQYDVIQVSGVDTYAASQAGAFALSENYLYTVEAFRDYLHALSPDGTLTFTRWLYRPERQTVRLCVIADHAFRAMGAGDGGAHTVVLAIPTPTPDLAFSVVLFRRKAFEPHELQVIRTLSTLQGYTVLWSPDGEAGDNEIARYFRAADRERYVREYPFRIEANTDDEPFFFEHNRFARLLTSREAIFGVASGQMLLIVTFLLVLASSGLFLMLPWWRSRTGNVRAGAAMQRADTVYFLCLGLGYISLETVLIPRFALYLGNPVHALSVVLFSLLVASGVGSALSPIVARTARRTAAVAVAVAAVMALYQWGLQGVFEATLRRPFAVRVAISVALLALPGVLMGMPFPAGLSRGPDEGDSGRWVSRAWVLNGWASVLGSVGAMILAIGQGFSVVLLSAAGCYLVAAAMAVLRQNEVHVRETSG